MVGLGWQELMIVLVIIMIIFGAGKLPQVAKSLGQGVKEFRKEATTEVEGEAAVQTSAQQAEATEPRAVGMRSEAIRPNLSELDGVEGVTRTALVSAPKAGFTATLRLLGR